MSSRPLYHLCVDEFGRFTFTYPSGAPVERDRAKEVLTELLRQYPTEGFISYDVGLRDAYQRECWTFANEPQRLGHGVYFFKAEQFPGEIKIGLATNSYDERLKGLISQFGKGNYVAFIEAYNRELVEGALHHLFQDHMQHGEFFTAAPVLEWIEEVTGREIPADEAINEYNRQRKLKTLIAKQEGYLESAKARLSQSKRPTVIAEVEARIVKIEQRLADLRTEQATVGADSAVPTQEES